MPAAHSIVIVEDELIAAEDIRRRLVSWGYRVPAVVATGEEAIKSAAQAKPDLVLMDIHIKGRMDGIQAAEQIRSQSKIPVIYATAYTDVETLKRANVSGPFELINKPYDDREIRAAIELALARRKFERRLAELEVRYRSLVAGLEDSTARDAAGQEHDDREAINEAAVKSAADAGRTLAAIRRCVGSLNATALTQEQRAILEHAEDSLHSLESLVEELQE